LECAAIQDVLMVGHALDARQHRERKDHLDRIAAMPSKLGGRSYRLKEDTATYGTDDPDFDFEDVGSQPMPGGDSASRNSTA
jgi:hypothetical protein